MSDTAIILDTETTGLKEPQCIEVAYRGPLEFKGGDTPPPIHVQRFRPTKDIEPGAMATHGIIPTDLVNEPTWPGAWKPPEGVKYLIGHNVDHDFDAIGRPAGVVPICTLVLARRLWEQESSHKLSTMMYVLFEPHTARDLVEHAHSADTDVHNCGLLLDACVYELQQLGATVQSWADLALITAEFRVPLRIGFSKYGPKNGEPGKPYAEVPSGFLRWMVDPVRVNDMDPWEVAAARQQLLLRGET